jgi:branched-chain amino acid transport system ATP-binding protein
MHMGIAQSPEGRRIFPRMTVLENLQMGAILNRARNEYSKRTWSRGSTLFPDPEETRKPAAGNHVRRRTADARDRARD